MNETQTTQNQSTRSQSTRARKAALLLGDPGTPRGLLGGLHQREGRHAVPAGDLLDLKLA